MTLYGSTVFRALCFSRRRRPRETRSLLSAFRGSFMHVRLSLTCVSLGEDIWEIPNLFHETFQKHSAWSSLRLSSRMQTDKRFQNVEQN
ncbi:hypothetical protein COCON_G00135990 [Conger conger]|uniref:Uncharacterized protein n=1 Tax=Conger conger TaxID=82655 RepID=A0A9Q1DES3_CONCO|nr:hypothetical protein COCON_G00135990 [Conger conger]